MNKHTGSIARASKALDISSVRNKVAIFSVLSVIILYVPTVISSQVVTGSLVNMTLVLATFLIGPYIALLLGVMPSSLALLSGLLPAPLAPMIPFIIAGNAILIGTYHFLGEKRMEISILTAALFKFVFLFASGYMLSQFIFESERFSILIASMFGWTQLFTAIIGGSLAYIILTALKRRYH